MRALTSPTVYTGTLLEVAVAGDTVAIILEEANGKKQTVALLADEEEEANIIVEQFRSFLMGKNILVVGNHEGVDNNIPRLDYEEVRPVTTTFREAVKNELKKRPLGIELGPVKRWEDVEKWFLDLNKALFNERYVEVRAEGTCSRIIRDAKLKSNGVEIPLTFPEAKASLLAVTQTPDGLDPWAEAAAAGKHITWVAFRIEPTKGATTTVRCGRVEEGSMYWNTGARDALIPFLATPLTEENLSAAVEASKTAPEEEVDNSTSSILSKAALAEVRGEAG